MATNGTKSRIAIFPEKERAELAEMTLPPLEANQILVKTHYSGISIGTDRAVYQDTYPGRKIDFPVAPGYMLTGEVIECGPGPNTFQVGEMVFVWPGFDRGQGGSTGMVFPDNLPFKLVCGGHASHVIARSNWGNVFRIPKGVTLKEACIDVLPGVALRGIYAAGGIQTGNTVLVYGLGVIGLSAAIFARSKGAEVVAVEPVENRRRLLENIAGVEVFAPDVDLIRESAFLRKESRDFRDRGGADMLIDTTAIQAIVNEASYNVRTGGRIVYSGMYSNDQSFDHFVAHTRELTAYFPYSTRYGEIEETLQAQASGLLDTKPFLTHTFRPEETPEAFSLLSSTPDDMVSICIEWSI